MRVLNRMLALLLLLALLAAALLTLGLVSGLLPVSTVQQVWPYAPVRAIARDAANLSGRVYQGQRVGAYVVGDGPHGRVGPDLMHRGHRQQPAHQP